MMLTFEDNVAGFAGAADAAAAVADAGAADDDADADDDAADDDAEADAYRCYYTEVAADADAGAAAVTADADVAGVAAVTAGAAAAGITCFHNTGPLIINRDPLATMAINDAHRRHDIKDGAGSDLWSLDQWAGTFPHEQLDNQYPVLSPIKFENQFDAVSGLEWCPATQITQREYISLFRSKFNIIDNILPINNVIVAGGAAAHFIGNPESDSGDVDIFIHGIDPTDDSALWDKVSEITDRLKASISDSFDDEISIDSNITPGLISFNIGGELTVQIILRAYPSISAILHGFDVPSCCVAFDGRITYLTTLSAWAHAFRVNIVNPTYRSTTYELRLIKYYRRGYAVMMPHLDKIAFTAGNITILPHIVVYPITGKGTYLGGYLMAKNTMSVKSDYEYTVSEIHSTAINSKKFLRGSFQFKMMESCWCQNDFAPWSTFQLFRDRKPSLHDILTREELSSYLDAQCERVVTTSNGVNIDILTHTFGLNVGECEKILSAIHRLDSGDVCHQLNVQPALVGFRDKILDRFDREPRTPIKWWITIDPSRQYTCSLNPRLEHPSEWYGPDAYVSETTQVAVAPPVKISPKVFISDGTCAICLNAIEHGSANTVVLACGHEFHYAATANGDCNGLRKWASKKDNCPTCRTLFADVEPSPSVTYHSALCELRATLRGSSGLVVEVEW